MDLRREGRILYISSVDVSLGNGPGVNESGFISALDAAIGDRAHFLIPMTSRDVDGLPVDHCTFVRSHDQHRPTRYAAHLIDQYRQAARLIRSRPFDLICVRLDVMPASLYSLLLRSSVPFVLKTLGQGPLNVLHDRGGLLGALLSGPNRWMFRKMVQEAVVADACSPSMARMLVDTLRVSPEKIVWVDNAVDVHRFRPQSAVEARVQLGLSHFGQLVGYVGSRPSERGGQAIVEAAPALLKHFPSLGFLVVGNGPRLDQVRVMARDLGVADRCVFVGHIPPDQVPNYVNALDVGVSINRRSDRFHSAELKVRQYIACGKPVVVTPGGNGFVEDAGLGTVISDERSLVEALASVLRWTSDESTAFSKRARDYAVRELSYERSLERRFDIWSERCFKR